MPSTVYNIKTDNHNYFAQGVLVHNCDDSNNPEKVESDEVREKTLRRYKDYSKTRRNNKYAPVINVQQRTHVLDVSGWIIDNDPEYTKIIIPTEAEVTEDIVFPKSGKIIHREQGDLMHPDRVGLSEATDLKADPMLWAGRYQQRPVPLEGGMIQLDWFQRYDDPPKYPEMIVLSLDTASKSTELSCPWVAGIWAVQKGQAWLLHVLRKRMNFPEGLQRIAKLVYQYNPDLLLIEDKSTGQEIIQLWRGQGVPPSGMPQPDAQYPVYNIHAVEPHGDKETRMSNESATVQAGRVWLPNQAPWLAEYEGELGTFPRSATADQVDMTSQFLAWLKTKSRRANQPVLIGVETYYDTGLREQIRRSRFR